MPGPGRGEVTLGQCIVTSVNSLAPQLCVATIPWVTVRQCITATTWNITRGDLNFWHYLSLGDNTTCYIAKFIFTFLQLSIFSVSVMLKPYAHCKLVKTFMLCLFSVGFLESWTRFIYLAAAWPLHLLLAPLPSEESRQVQGRGIMLS